MWCQIYEKNVYLFTKLLLEKSAKTKKIKNHESVNILLRVLGTKPDYCVDL